MQILIDDNNDDIVIDYEDIFDFDQTLARVIETMLRSFKVLVAHAPSSFFPIDLSASQLTFDFIDVDDIDEHGMKRWIEIIDQMIYAFSEIAEGNHIKHPYNKENIRRIDEGLENFAKYYKHFWM